MTLSLVSIKSVVFAQCTPQVRVYANSQQSNVTALLGAGITDNNKAVDGDLTSFSILKGGLAGTAIEFLKFPNTITGGATGVPVTVKLSLPSGVLSVGGGVQVQAFTNLNFDGGLFGVGWRADPVGTSTTIAPLLGLLDGSGDIEVTLNPKNANGTFASYDGVWVKLSGISVAQSINVYDAYVMQPTALNTACNAPIDVMSGVRATTALGSLANSTGAVTNPRNAIDGSLTSYADMEIGIQALSEIYHTTIFNSPTLPGDTVKMLLQDPGAGLVNLDLLSNYSIQLYNGTTPVGVPITNINKQLYLKLFPQGTDKSVLEISPPAGSDPYDRVELQIGGIATAGLSQGLRIYDVTRVIATPVIDPTLPTSRSMCFGDTAPTFTVASSQSCTNYTWYDENGNAVQSGTSAAYTPSSPIVGTHTYHVVANRIGCTETTTSTPVTLVVNPLPTITPASNPGVCTGVTTETLTYTTTNSPDTYSLIWDGTAHTAGFVDVPAGTPLPTTGSLDIAVPAGAAPGTYNGNMFVSVTATGCNTGKAVSVIVSGRPTSPVINISN